MSDAVKGRSCSACKHYAASQDSLGTCRFAPPFMHSHDGEWPHTRPMDWCRQAFEMSPEGRKPNLNPL